MKFTPLALIFLTLFASPVYAAGLPGLNDGPPGCGWRAAVLATHPGDDAVIDLGYQRVSTCMFNPGPCGQKEDQISVHVKKDDIRHYQVEDIVKVWVTGNTASFDMPQCVRNPG